MAKRTPASDDNTVQLEVGALNAVNATTPGVFFPIGRFAFTIFGVFVGTVIIERSFDGGATWVPVGALGSVVAYTTPVSENLEHHGEGDVAYRARMTARTSGAASIRFSQ